MEASGVLSDGTIRRLLETGGLIIEPLADPDDQIQPCSVDLRLAAEFAFYDPERMPRHWVQHPWTPELLQRAGYPPGFDPGYLPGRYEVDCDFCLDLDQDNSRYLTVLQQPDYVLPPHGFVLARTEERLWVPNDLLCLVEGRSSVGRLGIEIHITAGLVDPGWGAPDEQGASTITLEIANVNAVPVRLRAGRKICQVTYQTLDRPCTVPYGKARGSKYQGQQGIVGSRMHLDRKGA